MNVCRTIQLYFESSSIQLAREPSCGTHTLFHLEIFLGTSGQLKKQKCNVYVVSFVFKLLGDIYLSLDPKTSELDNAFYYCFSIVHAHLFFYPAPVHFPGVTRNPNYSFYCQHTSVQLLYLYCQKVKHI